MPTYTENFNLTKISLGDSPPDITVLNANFDTIDEFMDEITRGKVSLTGTGNTIFQSSGSISKTGLTSGDMVYLAKFVAPCDGVYKVTLRGYYPAGFASVHLISEESLLIEASNWSGYDLGTAGFFYNFAVVGNVKSCEHVLYGSRYIIDLESTNATYNTNIYCKAGQPYVIVAQAYGDSNTSVTVSNVTVTYGND